MNRAIVQRIADAVLYEGYILYPYRPAVKNRQRWTFGRLYPEAWGRAAGDSSSTQTQCLIHGGPNATFEAIIRFLHLTSRTVGEITPPLTCWPEGAEPSFRPVETLQVGDRLLHTWQEAEEREVAVDPVPLGELASWPMSRPFDFPAGRRLEPVTGETGLVAGVLVREQQSLAGSVEASAEDLSGGRWRVTLRVTNRTPFDHGDRDHVLLHALVSTHALLGVQGGEFVSLLDPPSQWHEAAAACQNVGTWPVLAGADGQKDTMLSSPIILYDYPQVAPESPADFFDGAEIDEMLVLRILTLTDDEKRAMAAVDERARALLARTESLPSERLRGLHGALRGLRPAEEVGHG
jgi:hydrogenase maturation protease